jgi:aminoglycoside 6-adenylyltransferase
MKNTDEKVVLDKLINWATRKPDIRVIILTSSRAKSDSVIDEFSDYDVVLAVENIKPYMNDDSWLNEFGKVLVSYREPIRLEFNFEIFIMIIQYENGLKIDFTLWPIDLLKHVAEIDTLPDYIDDGYKVILDKDGITHGMKAPSYRAYIPNPPTESDFQIFIKGFFYNIPYAAKHIRRGEFFPLKDMLNYLLYEKIRKLLEWKVEIDHNWGLKSWLYGKGLEKFLDNDILKEIEACWTGFKIEDNWETLFKTITLFCRTAKDVGKKLGYNFPNELEQRMINYLVQVRDMKLP